MENLENPTEKPNFSDSKPESRFGVPQAIFAGMIIIAASIYVSFGIPNHQSQVQGSATNGNNLANTGNNNPSPVPAVKVDVSADDDPALGQANAPVTIIEFSDFQCPFCRKFWRDTFPQLKKDYIDTGKVRFVYRDLPLPMHPAAEPSAQAGECAGDQGKFWELHDKIFEEQDKEGQGTIQYDAADIKKWAAAIGLAAGEFNTCLDSGKYKDEVTKDGADAQAAGATGTPIFFVNGTKLTGAQPFASFAAAIDAALQEK